MSLFHTGIFVLRSWITGQASFLQVLAPEALKFARNLLIEWISVR